MRLRRKFELGKGNYTLDRYELFKNFTIDDIADDIMFQIIVQPESAMMMDCSN